MSCSCACLCSSIRDLARNPDESFPIGLAPALNSHLKELQYLLAQSRAISREVSFKITSTNERVEKAFLLQPPDLAGVESVCNEASRHPRWFWSSPDTSRDEDKRSVKATLQRRLACIVVFLISTIDAQAPVPSDIIQSFQGRYNYGDIRNAGRKYLKVARKLGDLGSILWLPTSLPHTTYERYIHIGDEGFFKHLERIRPSTTNLSNCVQQLILHQLQRPGEVPDSSASETPTHSFYLNLILDNVEVLPKSSLLLLILHSLGGSNVPKRILDSMRLPQRRWDDQGEIYCTSASDFGIPSEIIDLVGDDYKLDEALDEALIHGSVTKRLTNDGVSLLSIVGETTMHLERGLLSKTKEYLGGLALRIMCFVCPPCFEGNLDWPVPLKHLVWPVFQRIVTTYKVPASLRNQTVEALFYFSERDSVPIRQASVSLAESLIRKSTPYYLQAALVLFQSTLRRIDAEFIKSEGFIRDFTCKGPKPTTRRDHSLLGRLHISHVENKIKLYDPGVASFIYTWEAQQPSSSLDIEVTSRLQSTAARFFQSVGDFPAARASLNQFLSLDNAKPIRSNSKRLLVGRLADMYCEMQDYDSALVILEREIERCESDDRFQRWYSRLLLAQVEANFGLGRMGVVRNILASLDYTAPKALSDIHDEQLHTRRRIALARVDHLRSDPNDAVDRWQSVMKELDSMYKLSGFPKAVVHLSLAHAQLGAGDRDGARRSWVAGLEILKRDQCEYWLPSVATFWLPWIAGEVHRLQGWSFRMKQPGGKPDVVWPLSAGGLLAVLR